MPPHPSASGGAGRRSTPRARNRFIAPMAAPTTTKARKTRYGRAAGISSSRTASTAPAQRAPAPSHSQPRRRRDAAQAARPRARSAPAASAARRIPPHQPIEPGGPRRRLDLQRLVGQDDRAVPAQERPSLGSSTRAASALRQGRRLVHSTFCISLPIRPLLRGREVGAVAGRPAVQRHGFDRGHQVQASLHRAVGQVAGQIGLDVERRDREVDAAERGSSRRSPRPDRRARCR